MLRDPVGQGLMRLKSPGKRRDRSADPHLFLLIRYCRFSVAYGIAIAPWPMNKIQKMTIGRIKCFIVISLSSFFVNRFRSCFQAESFFPIRLFQPVFCLLLLKFVQHICQRIIFPVKIL